MRALSVVSLVKTFSIVASFSMSASLFAITTGISNVAHAENAASETVNLSEVYGKATLVGMQLTIQKKASEGSFPAEVAACVKALPHTTFNSVFDTVLSDRLSESERAAATAFFSSEAGRKYSKISIVQIYRSLDLEVPEPEPEFSTSEYTELTAFSRSTAGNKLIMKRVLEGGSARAEVGNRVQELLRSCNDKIAKR
jgi:hypothetical protein